MLVYKDIITGDEILSEAYNPKLVDDVAYEVDCAMVQKGGEVQVDIGANPSAEEVEEGTDNQTEQVINVVEYQQLVKAPGFADHKQYMAYLKRYLKALKTKFQEAGKPEEEIKAFEQRAVTFSRKIKENWKNWDFYTGASMNPDGMIILLDYREDGVTPYMVYWKDGLVEEKY